MRPWRPLLVATLAIIAWLLTPASPVWADGPVHTIQAGETVYRIALNHGVTTEALRAANGLNGNLIYAGQALAIPEAAAGNRVEALASPSASLSGAVSGQTMHIVQPGETLFKIGLKYNLPWTTIQAANGLAGTKIYAGQRLTIGAVTGDSSAAAPVTANLVPTSVPAASTTSKWFLVDLSEQRLYAYEGETNVRTTLVSTGLPATPTVTGTFYIYARLPSQRMRGPGYDLPGVPYVQYFYEGYGLHGTYWHNNFGQPMSHGCVNMPTEEAEWAYNWADYETPVVVQP